MILFIFSSFANEEECIHPNIKFHDICYNCTEEQLLDATTSSQKCFNGSSCKVLGDHVISYYNNS